jgi:LuxR family maltose regulon positive regulatory protein
VLRLRNDLDAAAEHLAAAEALGAGAFSHEHRYRWAVGMAGLKQSEGDLDAALEFLATADTHYRRGFLPEVRPIGGVRARAWITQGCLAQARGWITQQGLNSADEPAYLREFGHITLARLLIADGENESLDQVLALLSRLALAAESGGRMGSLTEILMLQALALHARGQTTLALTSLDRALSLAEPEGQVRIFLDEGSPMLGLLRTAAGAGIRPQFVRALSQSLRNAGEIFPITPLPDPLSERELSVVRLLATQLTGPEITRELHVSLNTMRTHTKHIFVKLGVNDRAAAVRRAEALGLI